MDMTAKLSVVGRSDAQDVYSHQRRRASLPYAVRVQGTPHGHFDDLRDAIASARLVKREHPLSNVSVADMTTGQIVVEVEV